MPPLPRGRCPHCNALVAVRVNGAVREHNHQDAKCPGSGKQTTEENA
jgi:hypothetical protein